MGTSVQKTFRGTLCWRKNKKYIINNSEEHTVLKMGEEHVLLVIDIYDESITFYLDLDCTQLCSPYTCTCLHLPCRTSWHLQFWRVCWGSSTHSWISCHGRTREWTLSSTSAGWHGQRLFLSHACSGCFCRCCNSSSSRPEQQGQSQWLLLPSHICPLSTTEVNKLLDYEL